MLEKLSANFASLYGLKITVLRIFSAYGVGNKKQIFWELCKKLTSNEIVHLSGTGKEIRDWINIQDIIEIIFTLSQKRNFAETVINIGSGQGVKIEEAAELLGRSWHKHTNKNAEIVFTGETRPNDPLV